MEDKDIRAAAEEITFSKHDSLDDFRHLVEVVLRREVERERKEGVIEGITMYAYWNDGVQYVGTCGVQLKHAIDRIRQGGK